MSTQHRRPVPAGGADSATPTAIAAAGAVVWRGDEQAPEVALVHRPAYDDWSFPKGKVDAEEHLLAAALREVAEELGAGVRMGVPLPTARYTVRGVPKTVHYWSARWTAGAFTPNDEVDQVAWLPAVEARSRLSHAGDQHLLDAFLAAPRVTEPAVAVRHAKARSRSTWTEDDAARPLTPRGRRQADLFAALLDGGYGPLRVVTSPWWRCVQTVEPYAFATRSTLELLDVLGEDEFEEDVAFARDEIARLAEVSAGLILCSHGNVMPDIVDVLLAGDDSLAERLGEPTLAKGEFVIVHRSQGRPVAVERHRT
jgi:8-oxo-dGTP diphosphatase